MSALSQYAPALLSFFLPGLGQLSQKRYVGAMGFFGVFVWATTARYPFVTVPLLAVIAALETLRFPQLGRNMTPGLRIAYGMMGGLGFLCWFGLVSSFVLSAWAAPALEELKKADYSILLRTPDRPTEPSERCFLLPEVNNALVKVQQRLRVWQATLRVERCYQPKNKRFGRGAAVKVSLAKEGRATPKELVSSMTAEGFVKKGKGVFLHDSWKNAKVQAIPVRDLP